MDHDRAGEPREQHLVVFEREETEATTLELGDKEWTVGQQEKPRAFIEIDTREEARIRSWSGEVVVDLRELYLDGAAVKMKTAEHGKKAIDARKLLEKGNRKSEA